MMLKNIKQLFMSSLPFFGIAFTCVAMNEENSGEVNLPVFSSSMSDDDWKRFGQMGCGYFPMPDELRECTAAAEKFAKCFSKDPAFQNKEGHYLEQKQQFDYLLLLRDSWHRFPEQVIRFAEGMAKVGEDTLTNMLHSLGVDQSLFNAATGGLTNSGGRIEYKFIHYDHEKSGPGIDWHNDTRWITVLYLPEPGLQAKIDDQIIDVDPKEGYFFVMVGLYFQVFINDKTKVRALTHGVPSIAKKDRISMGAFLEGDHEIIGYYTLINGELRWIEDLAGIRAEQLFSSFFSSNPPHGLQEHRRK